MNEKELKKEINVGIDYANPNRVWKAIGDLEDLSFQKGKLEERERFGRIIHDLEDDIFNMSSLGMLSYMNVITRIKQLQKEIGGMK